MAQDDIYAENAPQSESEGSLREFFQSRRNQLIVGGGALGAALAITIGVMALNSNSEAQQAQEEAAATAQVNADESILDDSDYEGEYNPTETAAPTENVYAIRDSGGGGLDGTSLDADMYANTQNDLDDSTDSTNTKNTATTTADAENDEDPFAVESESDANDFDTDEPSAASSSQTRPADGAGEGVGYMDATPASELRAIELKQGQNYVTSNNLAVNISQIRSKENSDGSTGTCGVLNITNRGQVPYTLDENTDIDFFTVDVNYNETPVKGSIYATTIGAGETATFTPCVSATEVDAFGWRPPTAPDRVAFWNS